MGFYQTIHRYIVEISESFMHSYLKAISKASTTTEVLALAVYASEQAPPPPSRPIARAI